MAANPLMLRGGNLSGLLVIFILIFLSASAFSHEEYRLGPEDEIEIRVWSHDDLTRKMRVGLKGTISFPFVGEIKAQGLTAMDLQKELERRLGPKYIIDPHVSISVIEYKSQKFFVVGNVQKPGTYPLTKPINVVEAVSQAGGVSFIGAGKQVAGVEAVIVRSQPGEKADQPRLPEKTPDSRKITVSLSAAMAGDQKHNLEIKNGDTIYVPFLAFYVTGEVKQAGRYPYEENLTVLMAVTFAGGFSDKASARGTHIIREVGGKKEKIKVKLDDPVRPGDMIVVPESFF